MNAAEESQVLRWFEHALDQPASERFAWLDLQNLPPWLYQRVRRLVDAELKIDSAFLETAAPLPPAPAFPQVGERVGNYELLRELDAGGMGVVFLARRADKAYDQQVAIKLIRPLHLHAAPEFRRRLIARFENERALLARLDHRNVARILDGGSTPSGIPYLVMEYVAGASLLTYCDDHKVDVAGRLRLFRKVCDGVQEAHRHLIVHRDLKPENILVAADGEPRLLDFGIARTLEDAGDDSTATMLTAMTPAYASPEQVRRQPLTTSSDVYSLGVVLYQMLAGVLPYELRQLTPADAERLVCEITPAPLHAGLARAKLDDDERRHRKMQLAPDLDRIVAKAMHKDSARRYASAQELSDDLGRFLDGQPVLAHPDSAMYRVRKFVRRHRAISLTASVALTGILIAAGIAFWQAGAARRAAEDMRLINAFLLDVLQMSDPFDAGSELTLSQALDAAAERIDERFGGRPDLTAEIRFGIGYSMLSRYRIEAAERQLLRALEENKTEFGADDIRTLRALEGVAGLRQEQSRGDEAEALFQQAIAGIESAGLQADPLYVDVLGNLGNLYLIQERYPEADRMLQKALAAEKLRDEVVPLDHANLLSNLAHTAHGLEDYERADALYRQAQAAHEALFPNGNPDLAILLNNRALLAEDRGDQKAAFELHQQSLAVRRKVFGSEHPMIVVALANVARMSIGVGESALALSMAKEAAAMADRVYTSPASRHASIYGTLADARSASGDAAGAEEAWNHARDLLSKVTDAPPSVMKYLERVRTAICGRTPGQEALCVLGSTTGPGE